MAETRTHSAAASESLIASARELAYDAHSGQRRMQTGGPFIEHPLEVAALLRRAGFEGEVLVAAYLHDVPEKTSVRLDSVRERFGDEVARLVDVLTEDENILDYGERKRVLRRQVLAEGRPATVIYAADRVANLGDWTRLPAARREGVAARLGTSMGERLALWDEDLRQLRDADPELPFLDPIEGDLRRLRRGAA